MNFVLKMMDFILNVMSPQRMNPDTGALEAISIPDHIDILGKLASGECFKAVCKMSLFFHRSFGTLWTHLWWHPAGAHLNMTVSNVTVGENFFELQGTAGVLKLSLNTGLLTLNGDEVDIPESECADIRPMAIR